VRRLGAASAALLAAAIVGSALAANTTKRLVIKTDVGGAPLHVGIGFGSVWVADHRGGFLYRINPHTGKKKPINVGVSMCSQPIVGGGYVWVSGCSDQVAYYQVDPKTNRVLRQRRGLYTIYGAGSLWVYDGASRIVRVDPRTGVRLARLQPGIDLSQNGGPLGYWEGGLWVYSDTAVSRIDPETNKVTAVISLPGGKPSGDYAGGYLYGGFGTFTPGRVWVTNPAGLYMVDPARRTATLAPVQVHAMSEFGDIYASTGNGSIWVRTGNSSVARLDPSDGHVLQRYGAAGGGGGIAVGFNALWVANAGIDRTWREPIR
jgi:streptogramin lyase